MADYRKMYLRLFNAVTDAIKLLQNAQAETEEIYLNQNDVNIIALDQADAESDSEDKI